MQPEQPGRRPRRPAEKPGSHPTAAEGRADPLDALLDHLGESAERTPPASARVETPARSREATAHLRSLLKMAREATSILELRPLLEALLQRFLAITQAERGFIMLDWRARRIEVSVNLVPEDVEGGRLAVSQSILEDVGQRGRSLFVAETLHDSGYSNRESILAFKIRSFACVPMIHEGAILGLCYTDSSRPAPELGVEDIELLEEFADQAAVAIVNAQRHEALQRDKERLEAENAVLRREVASRHQFANILGRSAAMQRLFERLDKFRNSQASALIVGETGTGKELIAKALHFSGPRRNGPFVAVNCSSIPETLFESAFFGHKKGAFTGAIADQEGHLGAADGGTLFLDEIGELPIGVQAKLLRALQEGEYTPVGSTTPRRFDVRILSATHRDLDAMVRGGTFRQDLLYRLRVLPIEVPPLRARDHDVLLLAEHFIAEDAEREGKARPRLGAAVARTFLAYPWPGNIRELENSIHFAVTVCESGGTIELDHLPASLLEVAGSVGEGGTGASRGAAIEDAGESRTLRALLDQAEARFVAQALREAEGVVSHAAQRLGVSRQHLHNLIRKHGLKRPGDRMSKKRDTQDTPQGS